MLITFIVLACAPKKTDEQKALEATVAALQAQLEALNQPEAAAGQAEAPEQARQRGSRAAELQAELAAAQAQLETAQQVGQRGGRQQAASTPAVAAPVAAAPAAAQPAAQTATAPVAIKLAEVQAEIEKLEKEIQARLDQGATHEQLATEISRYQALYSERIDILHSPDWQVYERTLTAGQPIRQLPAPPPGQGPIGLPPEAATPGQPQVAVQPPPPPPAQPEAPYVPQVGPALPGALPERHLDGEYARNENRRYGAIVVDERYVRIIVPYREATEHPDLVIPASIQGLPVTRIDRIVFGGRPNDRLGLRSVNIPNSVITIGESAFAGHAIETLVIPDSVIIIEPYAFSGKERLKSVTIGSSVTTIMNGAFLSCYGLTSLNLGSSVRIIGDRAFQGCANLPSVVIPPSVESIGSRAFVPVFAGEEGLTEVTLSRHTRVAPDAFPPGARIIYRD